MPNQFETISKMLRALTHEDLASLYSENMECQVNVAADGGDLITGDYNGSKWRGWTDGLTTWKSFRIPYNANTEPNYVPSEMKWDLALHAEGIGLTGWDWKNKVSKWVAFDFDAITGHSDKHSKKLSPEEIDRIQKIAESIPWVTIRRSTSGRGLHIYVFLSDIPTENHNEHAALARAILGKMSAISSFDFNSKVDNCGMVMWVWHRKMRGTNGLELLKQGVPLLDIPANWKDHYDVIISKNKHIAPGLQGNEINDIANQRHRFPLDEGHKKLIDYLDNPENNCFWWWDQDKHMLVTHTIHLKAAHTALGFRGTFDTISTHSSEQNCFLFPLRNGSWVVKRYTPGVQEHVSWEQDGHGWTTCYLNQEPTFRQACRTFGGLEDPKGGFIFRDAESAIGAAGSLGVTIDTGTRQRGRDTKLKEHRDGRLICEIKHEQGDDGGEMRGWLLQKEKWIRIYQPKIPLTPNDDSQNQTYDDLVRHIVSLSGEDCGWTLQSDGVWRSEPLTHVKYVLASMGMRQDDITSVIGTSVSRCWTLVNKPFESEYPGNREWNRESAQLKFLPSKDVDCLKYPTWRKILNHIGQGLNDAVRFNGWCKANNITTGEDYLTLWIASLFQDPTQPLPYLFLCGDQNTGKSILHEALSLLLTKGYRRADAALINSSGFNAELEGSILCVVEETNLGEVKQAQNRIKDWVTSRELLIHAKGRTPYHIPNTTHWIQCGNQHFECPIFQGDTRITMIYVQHLDPVEMIPKKRIIPLLESEAPDFLAAILGIEIPESNDRLNVPVIETQDKGTIIALNQTSLDAFIAEKCRYEQGAILKFSDFYNSFTKSCDAEEATRWTKKRVASSIPPPYLKGRSRTDNQVMIANIAWKTARPLSVRTSYVLNNGILDEVRK